MDERVPQRETNQTKQNKDQHPDNKQEKLIKPLSSNKKLRNKPTISNYLFLRKEFKTPTKTKKNKSKQNKNLKTKKKNNQETYGSTTKHAMTGDFSVLDPTPARCYTPSLGTPERPLKLSAAKRMGWGRFCFSFEVGFYCFFYGFLVFCVFFKGLIFFVVIFGVFLPDVFFLRGVIYHFVTYILLFF